LDWRALGICKVRNISYLIFREDEGDKRVPVLRMSLAFTFSSPLLTPVAAVAVG
jgi:hypothetical protein